MEINESTFDLDPLKNIDDYFFTEAVFVNGHEKLKPLEADIQKIKDRLNEMIRAQELRRENYNANKFWHDTVWKDFEDDLCKIFGFRFVDIGPFKEKYLTKQKRFQYVMNCYVYKNDRYPIDGLVTENGFYDKSKSCMLNIVVSGELLKELEPEEILAVFLHEFGHGIDPAVVDINYSKANVLSKYMTDRNSEVTPAEKKSTSGMSILDIILTLLELFPIVNIIPMIIKKVRDYFTYKTKGALDKQLNKIKDEVKKDKSFSRKDYSEAYADNFARMYGYGPALTRALKKIDKSTDDLIKSTIRREKNRQKFILIYAEDCLSDIHKTTIHRGKALLKEYQDDLKDPNIPETVKKHIREDMKEIEEILKSYTTDFDECQNKVNQAIIDAIDESEKKSGSSNKKDSDDKKKTEKKE